jgi:hypothetical protein
MDGKVLAHLGFKSEVFSEPLTDFSAWVDLCTSSPQHDIKYQLLYLKLFWWRGDLYKYPMKNTLRTSKFLSMCGLSQRYRPGL